MRLLKVPILAGLLVAAVAVASADAQQCPPANALTDSVYIVKTFGRPGDTVEVPVYMRNTRALSAFSLYYEYDPSVITPIRDYLVDTVNCSGGICDTVYAFRYTRASRMNPSETDFIVQPVNEIDYTIPDNSGFDRIKLIGLTRIITSDEDVVIGVDSGAGPIMNMLFVINESAPDGEIGLIEDYVEPILVGVTQVGCQYSKYSDTTGNIDVALTTPVRGNVEVDVDYVEPTKPEVLSFSANTTGITAGGSVTFNWTVSADADSVIFLAGSAATKLPASTTSRTVSPSQTTTYGLIALNQGIESDPAQPITVTVTQAGSNNPPQVTLSPSQTFYEVEQGGTVSFGVSATDPDNEDLTLTASNLPGNSTFGPTNPVLGTGSVSGNFSFTPDINQSGSFTVTFVARDGRGLTAQTSVTITVTELQFDVLFTTSADGDRPVGGLQGTRDILLPINLVSSQDVYGVQFDFSYDDARFVVDSFVTTGRTLDYTVYDNIGQTPGRIRVVTFGLANEPIVTVPDTTAILYAAMSIKAGVAVGDYPVYIDSGWESVNPDPDFPSLPLVTDSGIIQVDRMGDVNLDKLINVADLVNIVSDIIDNFKLNLRQFATADVVTNDTVNVFDLVGVVNMIYGNPPSPSPGGQADFPDYASLSLDHNDLFPGTTDMMTVAAELPTDVAGVELEINYSPSSVRLGAPSLAAGLSGMALAYKDNGQGRMKVLVHFKSPTGKQIAASQQQLLYMPVQALGFVQKNDEKKIRLNQAFLSTANAQSVPVNGFNPAPVLPNGFSLAQNYPNPFNPSTTIKFELGANGITGASDVRLDIFNILGQRVTTLVDEEMLPGAYVKEWNGTTDAGKRVASGLYLYRLTVGDKSESKKMMLLK